MSAEAFTAPSLEYLAKRLPAFHFEAFVAQGGMGAVYKARQISLDRDVAIKILPREFGSDPEFRKSFETEAKAMARLNHPNLISVYDFGDVDGMPYIVMEFVNGKSLYHSCWNQQIDPAQAAAIAKQICEGLEHAHDNGIVHRDIKPANILLTPKVEPKIGDFGLARPADGDASGLIMGTPGYTAPEVTSKPDQADQRVDIFSVGAILYELLAGSPPPIEGSLPHAQISSSPALDQIWRKATHPNPGLRFQSAASMVEALDHWMRDQSSTPTTTTLRTRAGGPARSLAIPQGPSSPQVPAAAAVPTVISNSGNRTLTRNLVLIAVLLVAIAFTYKLLRTTSSARQTHNESVQKRNEAAKASTLQPPTAGLPQKNTALTVPEPEPETPRDSLDRLRSALASGNHEEFPAGTLSHQESHFLHVEEEMSWFEASDFAEAHGAHLAVIDQEEDADVLAALLPDDASAWIGAGTSGKEDWSLVDGRRWQLPSNPSGVGTHGALHATGSIRARTYEFRAGLILEWRQDGNNPGTLDRALAACNSSLSTDTPVFPPGTLAFGESHYLIIARPMNRRQAEDLARAAGGHLATPAIREESDWLEEHLLGIKAPDGLWIDGLRANKIWSWTHGEKWEFARWSNDADDGGTAIAFHPGKGWKADLPDRELSGTIIEWSSLHEDPEFAETNESSPGQDPDELTQQAANLLVEAHATRKTELTKNIKDTNWQIDRWLRNLNETQHTRWKPKVDALRAAFVENRIPDPEIQFAGVEEQRKTALATAIEEARMKNLYSSFDDDPVKPEVAEVYPQELIDFSIMAWNKQSTIDKRFMNYAIKVRDSYVKHLAKAQQAAEMKGQNALTKELTTKAVAAQSIDLWIAQLAPETSAITPGTIGADKPGVINPMTQESLLGTWHWNGKQETEWVLNADGSCDCKRWNLEGTWGLEAEGMVLRWNNGRVINFKATDEGLLGTNQLGEIIHLTRMN